MAVTTLRNAGGGTAHNVSADISTTSPYVTWPYNTSSSYPDIAGGGTANNSNDFDFTVASGTPDGHVINFTLDIDASNGGPWSDSFEVTVVCNHPPDEPHTPSPDNLASDQELDVDLSWTGTNPASPPSGQTLGRDQASTDTDDGSDWTLQGPTPGAPNGSQVSNVYLPLILRNH